MVKAIDAMRTFKEHFDSAFHEIKMVDRKPDYIYDLIALCCSVEDLLKIIIDKHDFESDGTWNGNDR